MAAFKWDDIRPGPQMAAVMVESVDNRFARLGNDPNGHGLSFVHIKHLHALPPSLSPEQAAVIEAAEKWRAIHGYIGASDTCSALTSAVDALHASLAPRGPVAEVKAAFDLASSAPVRNTDIGGVLINSEAWSRLRAAIAALSEREV